MPWGDSVCGCAWALCWCLGRRAFCLTAFACTYAAAGGAGSALAYSNTLPQPRRARSLGIATVVTWAGLSCVAVVAAACEVSLAGGWLAALTYQQVALMSFTAAVLNAVCAMLALLPGFQHQRSGVFHASDNPAHDLEASLLPARSLADNTEGKVDGERSLEDDAHIAFMDRARRGRQRACV